MGSAFRLLCAGCDEFLDILTGFQRQFIRQGLQSCLLEHLLGFLQGLLVGGVAHDLADHLGGSLLLLVVQTGLHQIDFQIVGQVSVVPAGRQRAIQRFQGFLLVSSPAKHHC
ncbi:MAG: hypothetical protein MOGDAGHF_02066 [Rhodocyclaceae bacterium]|nr:hypothetical protein [Rhodocyclaceae bacterium]